MSTEAIRSAVDALDRGDVDANYVVARWRATGNFQGIASTKRRIDTEPCEIYEFRDGLVAWRWAYGDPAEVSAQLTSVSPS
jgi:predicted ester cyclase